MVLSINDRQGKVRLKRAERKLIDAYTMLYTIQLYGQLPHVEMEVRSLQRRTSELHEDLSQLIDTLNE